MKMYYIDVRKLRINNKGDQRLLSKSYEIEITTM